MCLTLLETKITRSATSEPAAGLHTFSCYCQPSFQTHSMLTSPAGRECDVCHQCFSDMEFTPAVLPHKRYCTSACQAADRLGPVTCPVHDLLTQLEGCACEKSLLRLILELDAHRALPSTKASAEPSGAAEDSEAAAAGCTVGGAQAGAGAGAGAGVVSDGIGAGGGESAAALQAGVRELQCSLADVEVLSHFWDQQPQQWREEVTKGLHPGPGAASAAVC